MRDRSFKMVTMMALIFALSCLAVAYAAFSTTLRVSGTITANATSDSWDVRFEQLSSPTLTGLAEVETAPILTATQISGFNVNFYAPGDSVKYTWTVYNHGALDAVLMAKSIGTLTCAPATSSNATQEEANNLCNDLNFDITITGSNTPNEIGSVISASHVQTYAEAVPEDLSYKHYNLTVTWKEDSIVTLSGDVTVSVGESTFVYTQKQ